MEAPPVLLEPVLDRASLWCIRNEARNSEIWMELGVILPHGHLGSYFQRLEGDPGVHPEDPLRRNWTTLLGMSGTPLQLRSTAEEVVAPTVSMRDEPPVRTDKILFLQNNTSTVSM